MDIMKTAVLILPGVLDISLGITLDVMNTANRLCVLTDRPPLFDITLAGSGRRRERSGSGLEVGPLERMADLPPPELLLLPGANRASRSELEGWLATREVVKAMDRAGGWLGSGTEVAASCVSTFALAQAGLLDGRVATTSWWLAPWFRERFPRIDLDMARMVVRDGAISTAGAALAQADLMLSLVARHGSDELARRCARFLMLDHRVSQSQYAIASHLVCQTPTLQRADRWLQTHLGEPITLAMLAEALHMTPRTLSRHFASAVGMSPIQYVQKLRVERATQLLETGRTSIESVAAQVGYADASMLRKLLRRERGGTPDGIRPRSRRASAAGTAHPDRRPDAGHARAHATPEAPCEPGPSR
ncbi:MAG: helix-turn-helix domain-containing protein [Methyloversatilis sp.]|nr:helix-turn-helix domain-containing protein [Methyloversatilis sp.]